MIGKNRVSRNEFWEKVAWRIANAEPVSALRKYERIAARGRFTRIGRAILRPSVKTDDDGGGGGC